MRREHDDDRRGVDPHAPHLQREPLQGVRVRAADRAKGRLQFRRTQERRRHLLHELGVATALQCSEHQ